MFNRLTPVFASSICLVTISSAGPPLLDRPTKALLADAGTGPYSRSPTSGSTLDSQDTNSDLAIEAADEAIQLANEMSIREERHLTQESFRLQIKQLESKIDRLKLKGFHPWLNSNEVSRLKEALDPIKKKGRASSLQYAKAISGALGFADLIHSIAQALADSIATDLEFRGTRTFKLGLCSDSGQTFQFGTLVASPDEHKLDRTGSMRLAYFLTGSEYGDVDKSFAASTGRAGFGVLIGDPNKLVSSVSIASFLSPFCLDGDASISLKICRAPSPKQNRLPPSGASLEHFWKTANRQANAVPHLVDHIRAGDLWLSATYREFTGGSSQTRGGAIEGALTYAVIDSKLQAENPIQATTIALSCATGAPDSLGLNEVAIELRTPVLSQFSDHQPLYFSVRHGSRGDTTFGFEGHF